jgi:very-short-patch-repair endonuclease
MKSVFYWLKGGKMREDMESLTHVAREMRRNMTPAEALLWSRLRRRSSGFKFRRQAPIGQLIVDFACMSHRLIVEVDGAHHLGSRQDRERDRWLAARGFRVLRFQNHEILTALDTVLATVLHALSTR